MNSANILVIWEQTISSILYGKYKKEESLTLTVHLKEFLRSNVENVQFIIYFEVEFALIDSNYIIAL
jgi:hypothetical protein